MEPCLFFANKQDYTVGRTKFGINSFHSLLTPAAFPSLENPLAIWLKRTAKTTQKNQKPFEDSYTHILLSPHQSRALFSQPLWPPGLVCKMEMTWQKRVRVTDREPTQ